MISYKYEVIESIIKNSIEKLILNDKMIINAGNELSVCHRLAVYLENDFQGWNIDCEYRKQGIYSNLKRNNEGEEKRPDIIVHRRGQLEKNDNLLIIEVKLENDNIAEDEKRLKEFTSKPKGERTFQYLYGVSISFIPHIKLKRFENGNVL
jgi:hypothetical protein